MTDDEKLKSRMEFDDFFKLVNKKMNAMSCTIKASVIYEMDGEQTSFSNQEILLSNATYGSCEVTLNNLDSDKYYTVFKTDYQKFEYKNSNLVISGRGNGEKSYKNYTVTIIKEQ